MPFVVRFWVFLIALTWPFAAISLESPADRARGALQMLDAAEAELESAGNARDRVRALTSVIQGYEKGLGALRGSLQQIVLREAELASELAAQEADITALLRALQRAGDTTSPVFLLHPAGPAGTIRAGLLLAEVTPSLQAEADELRADLEELRRLRDVQTEASNALESGLQEVQSARAELNAAIADRAPLPKRFLADPVREAILISSADTLDAFAAGLDELSEEQIAPPPDSGELSGGAFDLPVNGRLLRAANEPDAAGVKRPGVLVAAAPEALVTAPVAGTLRYVGPLLDFGEVVILEPRADLLFVFAGLGTVYSGTGDVVDTGTPLGLMATATQKSATDVSTDGDEAGAVPRETLYIEVRQNNTPEDPSLWFRTDKDG